MQSNDRNKTLYALLEKISVAKLGSDWQMRKQLETLEQEVKSQII